MTAKHRFTAGIFILACALFPYGPARAQPGPHADVAKEAQRSVCGQTGQGRQFALTDAPTIAVDWNNGFLQTVELGGDRAFTFAGGRPGSRYLLAITQDTTGSRRVTWPSSVRWPGGPPQGSILTSLANKTDYIGFIYNGRSGTYDALYISQNY